MIFAEDLTDELPLVGEIHPSERGGNCDDQKNLNHSCGDSIHARIVHPDLDIVAHDPA